MIRCSPTINLCAWTTSETTEAVIFLGGYASRLFITAVPITKYRTFVALCDEAFLVSGWNVHSMRGTCESRRVLGKVSFFCVGERRARRAQAEGEAQHRVAGQRLF